MADSGAWFVDVDHQVTNPCQLMFLTAVYGGILYQASGLISDGSEMLCCIPSIAGIVGSIVLPILGAIPDGMMVLFAGLGPREAAQEQISVGVGALAGSTAMLLTFPWFVAIHFGRVPLDKNGEADYSKKNTSAELGLFSSGIKALPIIGKTAKIMILTTFLFWIIQIPAMMQDAKYNNTGMSHNELEMKKAAGEGIYALAGLIGSLLGFCAYLVYCFVDSNSDKELENIVKAVQNREISLGAALNFVQKKAAKDKIVSAATLSKELSKSDTARLQKVLKPFFAKYDTNNDKTLDLFEFQHVLHDLNENFSHGEARKVFEATDHDHSGSIDWDEFVGCVAHVITSPELFRYVPRKDQVPSNMESGGGDDDEDEDEEEESMPEDIAKMPKEEQQRRILFRSCYMMLAGTLIVLVISDPMVDVLNEWGDRLGVPGFYVSFLVAPFASNASELLSAYTYAVKHTPSSITTSLATLLGAACMNNTYCLAIFYALIYFQGLAWEFTAETFAIVGIQILIGAIAIAKPTQPYWLAFVIFMCYPGALVFTYCLQQAGFN